MFVSSGREDAPKRVNNWRRSYISRIPGENFGYFRTSVCPLTRVNEIFV
jgi:hypothetical protein